MGIFTKLSEKDIAQLLAAYGLTLVCFEGVTEGTVNTYYRVDTDRGLYYLRIDERNDENEVKKELGILALLTHFSVPHVMQTRDGRAYTLFGNKPALLFTPLSGKPIAAADLSSTQFQEIGSWLATLHRVDIPKTLARHRFHPENLYRVYNSIQTQLNARYDDAHTLLEKLFSKGWTAYEFSHLPQALIHADLFPENLLFENGTLSGVLDFEAAGRGPRLLDLAIALQALCFKVGKKAFNMDKAQALVAAYLKDITLTAEEHTAWPDILSTSALRFLITRLKDFEFSGLTPLQGHWKDYREYLDHLRALPQLRDLLAQI